MQTKNLVGLLTLSVLLTGCSLTITEQQNPIQNELNQPAKLADLSIGDTLAGLTLTEKSITQSGAKTDVSFTFSGETVQEGVIMTAGDAVDSIYSIYDFIPTKPVQLVVFPEDKNDDSIDPENLWSSWIIDKNNVFSGLDTQLRNDKLIPVKLTITKYTYQGRAQAEKDTTLTVKNFVATGKPQKIDTYFTQVIEKPQMCTVDSDCVLAGDGGICSCGIPVAKTNQYLIENLARYRYRGAAADCLAPTKVACIDNHCKGVFKDQKPNKKTEK